MSYTDQEVGTGTHRVTDKSPGSQIYDSQPLFHSCVT